jgi:hypothetical protein
MIVKPLILILGLLSVSASYPPFVCLIDVSPHKWRCLQTEWDGHCSQSEWVQKVSFTGGVGLN